MSLTVEQVMHKGIILTDVTKTIQEATTTLKENRIGAVGVTDTSGELVGMFSERDLVNKVIPQGINTERTPVKDIMTSPVITIKTSETAQSALVIMNDHRIRHLPVLDEKNTLVGMLGIRDLMTILMQQMITDFIEN